MPLSSRENNNNSMLLILRNPAFHFLNDFFDYYSLIKFCQDYKDLKKLSFNYPLRRYMIAAQNSAGFKQGWRRSSRAEYLSTFYYHCCSLCFLCCLGSKERDYTGHLSRKQFVFSAHNFLYYC